MVAWVVNISARERQNPLQQMQQSHCNEAVATNSLQSNAVYSYLQLFHIRIS